MERKSSHCLWFASTILMQTWCLRLVTSTSWISNTTHFNNFTDQIALLTFKSHITLYPNDTLSNWNKNTSFCNWTGVSCSLRRQRVTKLNLHGMGLQGVIPPYIANLSFLINLNLSYNNLHGYLPHELGLLRRLKVIDLGENKLTGTIPPSLANLSTLVYLGLYNNSLEGNIPIELGHLFNLQHLDLYNNSRLSGEIPLAIFNISSLRVLSLSENSLSGQFPVDTGRFLPNLEELYIYNNQMNGMIPVYLSNSSTLTILDLGENNLTGSIPDTLGHLLHLEILKLEMNNLSGTIPSSIFNLSHLFELALGYNQLSGQLPPDMGNWLPSLGVLIFNYNKLSGQIPISLGNASQLYLLDVARNNFSGSIPFTLGKLSFLRILNLHTNQFMNEPGTKELNFLTYLTRCKFLEVLVLAKSPLRGILPSTVGNFSNLLLFIVEECHVEGEIPKEIGDLSTLITLSLESNNLHGTIPSTIGRLENLQRMSLGHNNLEGSIPTKLSHLRYLGELFLDHNMLSGAIPDIFKSLNGLQRISLENNKLSRIPSSFWNLQELLFLNLSHNSLRGFLPNEVGNLKKLVQMDLSINQFEGSIPNSMGQFQMLQLLDLRSNSFTGPIPLSFGELISLVSMDLSSNHLNGSIPRSLETLQDLEKLDLSFNTLEGEIPSGGVFQNLTAKSFIGNSKLCSTPELHIKFRIPTCIIHETRSRTSSPRVKIIVSTLVVTTFIACFSLWALYHRKKKKVPSPIDNSPTTVYEMISYQELVHATDNFNEANLIGVGSFGSVYKGTMVDGRLVAVKVLNIQSEAAWKSFDAECKVMRSIRHRNLIKIITTCSNLDFRSLVLQFMPNGNLDQWLYSYNNYLSILQRIDIMIDVASAMEYLHHHYSYPIVHCDLKPSNILLDEDMVAHVGDFGISILLDENKSATQTNTLGTIGYVAPEYGLMGKVSTKGDVYSYGILLLEMMTRKKPAHSMFIEGLSLVQWVTTSFPDAIMDILDTNLFREISSGGNNTVQVDDPRGKRLSCMLSIVEVGLLCSREVAKERIDMKEVVVRLTKIKNEFLSI